MNKSDKIQEVLSNEEIVLRLIEVWANSEIRYFDDVLMAYDKALEHLKGE